MSLLFPTAKSDPELAPFRPALVFGFFNALTWQIAIGTPMVLFAERLGATSFQVGLAYSFVFTLTPLQIAATALLPRFGFKRLSLGGWGARSVFLTVPIVLALLAPEIGRPWMVNTLVWSVFLFCFFRSLGAAAMTTWFIGILPPGVRGRYFASDQFFSGIAGVGTLIACSALFALLPIYPALLVQYVIGLIGSTLSYYSLKKLPDIDRPTQISLGSVLRDTPRHIFARSDFRHYLWIAVWYTVISTPIPPFAAYYLKVSAHLSAQKIMLFEVLRYGGVVSGAWFLRPRIDRIGARPFFILSLVLTAAGAVCWWLYLHYGMTGAAAMYGIYLLVGLGWVGWTVANLNYLPKVTPESDRALMVSVYGAVTQFIGGCAPILWGLVLKSQQADGTPGIDRGVFQWFFFSVAGSAMILIFLAARLKEGASTSGSLAFGDILNPFRALSFVTNLIDAAPRKAESRNGEKR